MHDATEHDDSVGLLCYATYTAASSSTEEQDDGWKGHTCPLFLVGSLWKLQRYRIIYYFVSCRSHCKVFVVKFS